MEDWTVKMHRIAEKTEQETVLMLVITVFTLVFLPATFVSVSGAAHSSLRNMPCSLLTHMRHGQTFFSSNIIDFDNTSGSNHLGDWGIRRPALYLFLVLCLPLNFALFLGWLLYYCRMKGGKQNNTGHHTAESEERGL